MIDARRARTWAALSGAVWALWSSAGCVAQAPEPEPIVLEVRAGEDVDPEQIARLLVWVKRGRSGLASREVLAEASPFELVTEIWARRGFRLALDPGPGVVGTMSVYIVGVGTTKGETDRWPLGAPVGVALLEVQADGPGGVVPVELSPYLLLCDEDGDYFQRCDTFGTCCPDFEGALDCVDQGAPGPGLLARDVHPWRLPLDDTCNDGVDLDCDGIDGVCDADIEPERDAIQGR